MKRRFSEEQIIGIVKEHEGRVSEIGFCQKHVSSHNSLSQRDATGER